jgi:glycolate oxidase iron-sulfur subunit
MQTSFSLAQLADPQIAESNKILRSCVHCGFCTATCPTYVLLGDELDSPRGRIYLIKDMLENDRPATPDVVRHVDRCLSCLACMTTCPSGVNYMHLVDHAREYIETTYRRPFADAALRFLLAKLMPRPKLFRLALLAAMLGKPFAGLFDRFGATRLAAMLRLAPRKVPPHPPEAPRVVAAQGTRQHRVALLSGCVAPILSPQTNAAAERLLSRHGVDVLHVKGEGCCGSLAHHMGRGHEATAQARANIDAWTAEIEGEGLDAILVTVSGCGTTIKDYGFLFRDDPAYAAKAARVSALARDISEFVATLPPRPDTFERAPLVVAYHAACSLQHGQKVTREPRELLVNAGFQVRDVPEGHLCCGSAGTYNMLQPALARQLRDRKVANIATLAPDVIAAGNIGCITQIAAGTAIPVVHTVELLDWAEGGPMPPALARLAPRKAS